MKSIKSKVTALAAAMGLSASVMANDYIPYEVYAADQSNSVPGAPSLGVDGSYVWVWKGEDVEAQLAGGPDAKPLKCNGSNKPNPKGLGCDIWDIFSKNLREHDGEEMTGNKLGDLPSFGKLHGMLPDPQNRYMNINMFAPGGGFVGIMDGATKEAVALWKVTTSGTGRTMHMTFWSHDGSAIYIANLSGRILERIDIKRDNDGQIEEAVFRRDASLFVGKNPMVVEPATAFKGKSGHGGNLVSSVEGDYDAGAMSQLTPAGVCKENGCANGSNAPNGGRPVNVIVCPISTDSDNVYITFGGGGLLVADGSNTPMNIVAEYDQQTLNGAGCGGIQIGDDIWLNAGASASETAGVNQSTFTMYTIDDSQITGAANGPNEPAPTLVYKDPTNTATTGNIGGTGPNLTGQLPGISTRRDAHGMARTVDGAYIHQADRIQNTMTVFDTANSMRIDSYDLTSPDGQGGDGSGACELAADSDVPDEYKADPAPDLMGTDPNGNYLVVATRGPIPVSVRHAAQGSCPGVGIIELTNGGMSGKLAGVLRTTNTVDNAPNPGATNGYSYTGDEYSDPHGASVRIRAEDM